MKQAFSLLIAVILSAIFWRFTPVSLLLALPLWFILAHLLNAWSKQKTARKRRQRFLLFLQDFDAQLSVGQQLSQALSQASQTLDDEAQLQVKQAIQHARPLDDLASEIEKSLALSEARPLGLAIRLSNELGKRLPLFISRLETILLSKLKVEDRARADSAKQRSEASILLVLPFVMSPLLSGLTFSSSSSPLRFYLCFIAFAFSLLALYLFSGTFVKKAAKSPERRLYLLAHLSNRLAFSLANWLEAKLQNRLSTTQQKWLTRQLVFASPKQVFLPFKQNLTQLLSQWLQVLPLALIALPVVLVLSPSHAFFWIPFFSFLVAYPLFKQWQTAKQNRLLWKHDFLLLISLLQLLLQNQIPLLQGLSLCLPLFRGSDFQTILQTLTQQIRHQQKTSQSLLTLAELWEGDNLSSTFLLLKSYEDLGHPILLDRLAEQCDYIWFHSSQELSAQFQRQSQLILLPMLLDFVALMLLALAPALELFAQF